MSLLITNALLAQTVIPSVFEDKYCSGCHALDKKLVGPAIKAVATKYRGQSDARTYLAGKIRNGGVGVWGSIPMPAAELTDAELKLLLDWIVDQ